MKIRSQWPINLTSVCGVSDDQLYLYINATSDVTDYIYFIWNGTKFQTWNQDRPTYVCFRTQNLTFKNKLMHINGWSCNCATLEYQQNSQLIYRHTYCPHKRTVLVTIQQVSLYNVYDKFFFLMKNVYDNWWAYFYADQFHYINYSIDQFRSIILYTD